MKKLVIALMAFALVITLAGCGGGGGGSSEHWGDKGANLDDAINANYKSMKVAFAPETVNKLTTESARSSYIKDNFTGFIKAGVYFMNNKAYTREKMNSRMTSVLGSYDIKEYSLDIGETAKVSDTKYTSWVFCHLYALRNSDSDPRNQSQWMKFTWEKASDGKWYIIDGFDNAYWFEKPGSGF